MAEGRYPPWLTAIEEIARPNLSSAVVSEDKAERAIFRFALCFGFWPHMSPLGRKLKPQHWCGFPSIFAPNTAWILVLQLSIFIRN